MSKRKIVAIIDFDEAASEKYVETNGLSPVTPDEYFEREFGWIEQSGFTLDDWIITDEDADSNWSRYINYLVKWIFDHSGYGDPDDMTPPSFSQWFHNQNEPEVNTEIRIRNVSAEICDAFEDLLERHDITIPSEDRTGDESEARIYGESYYDLEKEITWTLYNLCRRIKDNPKIVINQDEY